MGIGLLLHHIIMSNCSTFALTAKNRVFFCRALDPWVVLRNLFQSYLYYLSDFTLVRFVVSQCYDITIHFVFKPSAMRLWCSFSIVVMHQILAAWINPPWQWVNGSTLIACNVFMNIFLHYIHVDIIANIAFLLGGVYTSHYFQEFDEILSSALPPEPKYQLRRTSSAAFWFWMVTMLTMTFVH